MGFKALNLKSARAKNGEQDSHFQDGSTKEVDASSCAPVIKPLPFRRKTCIKTANGFGRLILQGVVWERTPGPLPWNAGPGGSHLNMFDAHLGRPRCDYGANQCQVDAMKKIQVWRKREEKLENAEQMIWFQGDYVKELIDATDYPSFDVEGVNKTFLEWEHDKMHDIMAYRNKSYHSLMTGTMSPAHHTPWKDELDDTMEAYLKS